MIIESVEQDEKKIRLLIESYRVSGETKYKNNIIKSYMYLVEKLAKNYSYNHKEQYDDLVQVGCIGLLSAIDKFDLSQKVNFKTYSYHFISGEMKHYIRDHVSIVKLPRELQELYPKVNRVRNALNINNNLEANEGKIAELLDISIEKVKQTLEMESNLYSLSLDQQINNDSSENSVSYGDQLEDKDYNSFQLAQEDKIILTEAINNIKEQSKQVIEYAFYQDLSQTEIAKKLGISQMQVSRRIKGAVSELWDILNTRVTPW